MVQLIEANPVCLRVNFKGFWDENMYDLAGGELINLFDDVK